MKRNAHPQAHFGKNACLRLSSTLINWRCLNAFESLLSDVDQEGEFLSLCGHLRLWL